MLEAVTGRLRTRTSGRHAHRRDRIKPSHRCRTFFRSPFSERSGPERIPMDVRVLLVTARLQRIEYRALLAMAVGVGGGGEGTVIELQKHATQDCPVRALNARSLFDGLRRLQLAHSILNRSPQSGSTQQQWAPLAFPWRSRAAFATGVRLCGPGSARAASGSFVFLTREVWSVMP